MNLLRVTDAFSLKFVDGCCTASTELDADLRFGLQSSFLNFFNQTEPVIGWDCDKTTGNINMWSIHFNPPLPVILFSPASRQDRSPGSNLKHLYKTIQIPASVL